MSPGAAAAAAAEAYDFIVLVVVVVAEVGWVILLAMLDAVDFTNSSEEDASGRCVHPPEQYIDTVVEAIKHSTSRIQ